MSPPAPACLPSPQPPTTPATSRHQTAPQEKLGLTHLAGTPLLRAYMHGFFIDNRLYSKAKAMAGGALAARKASICPVCDLCCLWREPRWKHSSLPCLLSACYTSQALLLHPLPFLRPHPAADPFAYDAYRAKRVQQKLEEERRSRISLVMKLPKAGCWG